jgi:hypothetical protein
MATAHGRRYGAGRTWAVPAILGDGLVVGRSGLLACEQLVGGSLTATAVRLKPFAAAVSSPPLLIRPHNWPITFIVLAAYTADVV